LQMSILDFFECKEFSVEQIYKSIPFFILAALLFLSSGILIPKIASYGKGFFLLKSLFLILLFLGINDIAYNLILGCGYFVFVPEFIYIINNGDFSSSSSCFRVIFYSYMVAELLFFAMGFIYSVIRINRIKK